MAHKHNNYNQPQPRQTLTPFEKQQMIAQNAHDEYQGRGAAVAVACIGILILLVGYFTDLGIFSLFVRTIADFVLLAVDPIAAFFGITRVGALVVLLIGFVLWVMYQNQMGNRAHNRYNFFGDRDPEH